MDPLLQAGVTFKSQQKSFCSQSYQECHLSQEPFMFMVTENETENFNRELVSLNEHIRLQRLNSLWATEVTLLVFKWQLWRWLLLLRSVHSSHKAQHSTVNAASWHKLFLLDFYPSVLIQLGNLGLLMIPGCGVFKCPLLWVCTFSHGIEGDKTGTFALGVGMLPWSP